ncbi:hypothetical protein RUM43_003818 [Polyplax serrata]|uniref:Uncharacterized protein n=1 Tax=Polyplax serrata TaxID=468196 RepID=A0AAN8PPU6_POLSC
MAVENGNRLCLARPAVLDSNEYETYKNLRNTEMFEYKKFRKLFKPGLDIGIHIVESGDRRVYKGWS